MISILRLILLKDSDFEKTSTYNESSRGDSKNSNFGENPTYNKSGRNIEKSDHVK